MTFYIDKILLWLKDGSLRSLQFCNDKVNVITGNSKTGKTAILEIIDYCLCGGPETVVISREHIGENVQWYGIRFCINEKIYTVARGSISAKGKFSNDFYFSQTGEIPDIPYVKLDESGIKKILNQEFSIDDDVTISHGGKGIRKDSHLSFRYFLVMNTLSKDIVLNGKAYFDKMTIDRYRDAWHQIFDLSLGIITPQTLATQKQIDDLKHDLYMLDNAKRKAEKQALEYRQNQLKLVKKAKEACLIDEALSDDDSIEALVAIIDNGFCSYTTNYPVEQQREKLLAKRDDISIRLAKLKRFQKSYGDYKKRMKAEQDALSPISYIRSHFSDRTQGEYHQFLTHLESELSRIRSAINEKRPFELDIESEIKRLNKELTELDKALVSAPNVEYRSLSSAEKLVCLGELRAEYKQIKPNVNDPDQLEKTIIKKNGELENLEAQQSSVLDRRALSIHTLNDYIQQYITVAKDALDEYGDYKAWFDYKRSYLYLKQNQASSVANISSSSDHLFLHLCLFAGLHNMLLAESSNYVPSFLIIDQPSMPYFNTQKYNYTDSETVISNKDDWSKVKGIFSLWDSFFDSILSKQKHFQVIMLEHVSERAWAHCKHTHLVDIFDGISNALIPPIQKATN